MPAHPHAVHAKTRALLRTGKRARVWLGRPDLNRRMEESKSSAYRLTLDRVLKDRVAVPARSLVGCLEGFEPSASRATIWRANQLRHRHHTVRPKGLEPPAHCLEGSCSLQLSYGRIMVLARWGMLRRILYQMRSGKSRGAAAFFGFFSLWAAPGPQSTARTTKESCTPPKFGSCPACGRRGVLPAARTARRCQKSARPPGW